MPTLADNLTRIQRMEVIDRKSAEFMRRLTGEQRLRMACKLEDGLRRMVKHAIRTQHPDWTDMQVLRELARRAGYGSIWPDKLGGLDACSSVDPSFCDGFDCVLLLRRISVLPRRGYCG